MNAIGRFGSDAISRAVAAASPGPLLEGTLVPLVGVGKIRVTYNWLYSALNCDLNDSSPFEWVFHKMADGKVALSPKDGYSGMTLFASVRPDWDYYVQVQAPFSADWITQARGDEEMTMHDLGFLTINLTGLNGNLLSVNGQESNHGGHSGYKLQSNAGSPSTSTNIFVGVSKVLQSGLELPLKSELNAVDIEEALQGQGGIATSALVEKIALQMN